MSTAVRVINGIRITRRLPGAPLTPIAAPKAKRIPAHGRPSAAFGVGWFDAQRDAMGPLRCGLSRELRNVWLKTFNGKAGLVNLDVGLPREIWVALLWNGADDFEKLRSQLLPMRTVRLRKTVDPSSGEVSLDIITSGSAARFIAEIPWDTFYSPDHVNAAVLSWLLEASGVDPQTIRATLPRRFR